MKTFPNEENDDLRAIFKLVKMENEVELEKELRERLKSGIVWEDLFLSLLDPKQECKVNRHVINRFLARIEFLGKKIFEYENGINIYLLLL